MGGRLRLIIAGAAALLIIGYLVATGLGSGTVYYYTVDEIDLTADNGRVVRLAGRVMPGSLQWRPDGPELTFEMGPLTLAADPHGGQGSSVTAGQNTASLLAKPVAAAAIDDPQVTTVPVHYGHLKPDLLAEDVEVVAQGTIVDGVFHATELLVKCPSKYEAEVV